METDARSLMAAAQRGDRNAAEGLIGLFYQRIFAFLRRLAGSEAEAADLTQRTFTKAWSSLSGYLGRASVSSWLHGIAWHVLVDWRRANGRFEARPDAWWELHPATDPTPFERASISDLATAAFAAVDRLEPDLRAGVHLHYYQGLTLQESAEALGVSVSTIKYRLRAALDQLKTTLDTPPAGAARLTHTRTP